eukprot:NODE_1021_length_1159_cov_187.387387_g775_i0.p1 GENE.NODE_1021_length_1159_cov_187.387387_g775_i0~~NODE_1021_length_1159_cov_187.387387_g775_i0.p1  ORF type:complete len:200 (+),score=71.81 NODE_1021_length_1159_cov_187.387387_g775_i0:95-694(+)
MSDMTLHTTESRALTPGSLDAIGAALESDAMSVAEVEATLLSLGVDVEDDWVQAILGAYRGDPEDPQEGVIPFPVQEEGGVPEEQWQQQQQQQGEGEGEDGQQPEGPNEGDEEAPYDDGLEEWLISIDLLQYLPIFQECGLTVADLPKLTNASLRMMDIIEPEHRATILNDLKTRFPPEEKVDTEIQIDEDGLEVEEAL